MPSSTPRPADVSLCLALVAGLMFVGVAACDSGAFDAAPADGSSPEGGDGGPPVDPCVNTPTDPKCLDEGSALFVSAAGGAAGADGTRSAPFKTIGAALAKVTPERKRIYVCEGDYPEQVEIVSSVSLFGGLACSWEGPGGKPRIAPPKGVAVKIMKAQGVALATLAIEGKADAQVKGDSAVGVFVSESQGVVLKEVDVKAGPGVDGANGADGSTTPNYTGDVAVSGINGNGATGGAEPSCGVCKDTSYSKGGKGGNSGAVPGDGSAQPAVGASNVGGSRTTDCDPGLPGAAGNAPATSAKGATKAGTLQASAWSATSDAEKGRNGNPGQGGGGGGSTTTPALGGGSGGCGGCGGSGGGAGGNGGSSFALLVFQSDVRITAGSFAADLGGAGGNGGTGQSGQFRGAVGAGACAGGVGGHGAGGGGGGGGAGGHSAAIAYLGSEPAKDTAASLTKKTGGAQGAGGTAGTSAGNAGPVGLPGAEGKESELLAL